jgi:hypothetical protein
LKKIYFKGQKSIFSIKRKFCRQFDKRPTEGHSSTNFLGGTILTLDKKYIVDVKFNLKGLSDSQGLNNPHTPSFLHVRDLDLKNGVEAQALHKGHEKCQRYEPYLIELLRKVVPTGMKTP